MGKSPRKPRKNAAGQEKVSSSAWNGKDVLNFDIVRQPRSSRDAMKEAVKEMDVAEALLLLQEPRGKDTYSDDEPGVGYSGIESGGDNPDKVLTACSDKRTSSVDYNSHPVVEIEERLSSNAIDNSDVVQKDNQKLDRRLEFDEAIAVINLLDFKSESNSASVDLYGGTKKCANGALLVKELELTHNDDEMGKSPRKPRKKAAGHEKVSSSAWNGKDVLNFEIVRRTRSSRGAMKEAVKDMDVAEALLLLQEPRGKDTSSDDEPGVHYSGIESGGDNPDEVLTVCSDKRTSSVDCNYHPVGEIEERLSSKAIDSHVVQKDNQKLYRRLEFDEAIAVINLLGFKSENNSASVDLYGGTKKCANEALMVEELELTHNDDGQVLVDCPENSSVMELKRPKLDLKVSEKSENPASDNAQDRINDALESQISLTEPTASLTEDQEPEQKLDALEEQAAKGTKSVDEPGTDNPGDESDADNSNEVLTSCSEKSLCPVECYGDGESTSNLKEAASAPSAYIYGDTEKSGNDAPVVEEEERSRKCSRQALAYCPGKSAVFEVEREKPKLDHEVLDTPAPSNSSEEESSDIIDGEANQTA